MEGELNLDGYLSTQDFGKALSPPRTKEAVCWLCNAGKIQGAKKITIFGHSTWIIPVTALDTFDVKYRHRRTKKQIAEDNAKALAEKAKLAEQQNR